MCGMRQTRWLCCILVVKRLVTRVGVKFVFYFDKDYC